MHPYWMHSDKSHILLSDILCCIFYIFHCCSLIIPWSICCYTKVSVSSVTWRHWAPNCPVWMVKAQGSLCLRSMNGGDLCLWSALSGREDVQSAVPGSGAVPASPVCVHLLFPHLRWHIQRAFSSHFLREHFKNERPAAVTAASVQKTGRAGEWIFI